MKLDKKKFTTWIGAMAIAALTPLAHAAPFVNGGFESGVPGGWSFGGTCSLDVGAPHSGLVSAFFTCEDTESSTLSQVLDANAGGYNVDFWVVQGAGLFGASFGYSLDAVQDVSGFDHFSGFLSGTDLTFTFSGPGILFLDDVNVVAQQSSDIPEPGTLLLVGAALAGMSAVARRRGKQQQV